MVRGIQGNWKQPLAYFLINETCSSEDLQEMIRTIVVRLHDIGLRVRVFISDQGSNFYKLHRTLGVTKEQPHFYVNEHKIFYMFDIPHLLKSTRNNFFKYVFVFEEKEIRKVFLDQLFEYDSSR